ncbi:glycerate kinase, partial [Bordetella pertussis]|uniref:glycerate kinase n=1 Tax=Bordetella pertussis TaxID=520 RepID=UPI000ACD10AC
MKIVIAPDSFKESLSAPDAAAAIARGVRQACPGAHTLCIPMADGGEGTVQAVLAATGGQWRETTVHDGGAGMLTALGVRWLDADGRALAPGGAA